MNVHALFLHSSVKTVICSFVKVQRVPSITCPYVGELSHMIGNHSYMFFLVPFSVSAHCHHAAPACPPVSLQASGVRGRLISCMLAVGNRDTHALHEHHLDLCPYKVVWKHVSEIFSRVRNVWHVHWEFACFLPLSKLWFSLFPHPFFSHRKLCDGTLRADQQTGPVPPVQTTGWGKLWWTDWSFCHPRTLSPLCIPQTLSYRRALKTK